MFLVGTRRMTACVWAEKGGRERGGSGYSSGGSAGWLLIDRLVGQSQQHKINENPTLLFPRTQTNTRAFDRLPTNYTTVS